MNREAKIKPCAVCGQDFKQYKSTVKVCSTRCAITYAREKEEKKRAKEWRKEQKERKEKLKTWENYYQEALKAFNFFIRERDRDKNCISCGKEAGTYTLTSGHFYPQGTYRNLGLDEDNAHGQCWYNCNKNKHGNIQEYRPRLIERIGLQKVEDLDQRRNKTRKYTIEELKDLKKYYNGKARDLVRRRKL